MDSLYRLTERKNSEIRFKWCKLSLLCGSPQILKTVSEFLVSQGRMKFVRPLYRSLMEAGRAGLPGASELAVGTFAANRLSYHPICRKMVASDLDRALKESHQANQLQLQEEPQAVPADVVAPRAVAVFAAGVGFGAALALALLRGRR
mmetsp:Transcript_12438/g.29268  ORF Transcript_12438/g.29268 Transcript_12438/m.29268 type:complete len:148 (-) Transcript_12438:98-541(-)